jgi:pyruvate/2-oxoglutarate/acetoin dehydrogenase E1 component
MRNMTAFIAESLNLAAIWDLPVLFVLENNRYAVSSPIEGIEAEVIDLRTLVPPDKQLILDSVRKTEHLVIVQKNVFKETEPCHLRT